MKIQDQEFIARLDAERELQKKRAVQATLERDPLLRMMRTLARDNGAGQAVNAAAAQFLWDIGERT